MRGHAGNTGERARVSLLCGHAAAARAHSAGPHGGLAPVRARLQAGAVREPVATRAVAAVSTDSNINIYIYS